MSSSARDHRSQLAPISSVDGGCVEVAATGVGSPDGPITIERDGGVA